MTSPGTRIKELRILSGLSQEELGRRVGVQRAAINKYEKGSVTNIPLAMIEKIANVFEVSPTFIVGWNNPSANPLSDEVKVIEGVQRFYGNEAVEILEIYSSINNIGRERILQYCQDIDLVYHEETEDILL